MKKLLLILVIFILAFKANSACIRHCVQCPNEQSCTKCEDNFFLTDRSECKPCPRGCKTCQAGANRRPVCTSCQSNAQLDSNSMCFTCDPNCKTCSGSSRNCTSCQQGLTLLPLNNMVSCFDNSSCGIDQCTNCTFNQTRELSVCNQCANGFFNFRRQCDQCRFPCSNCQINLQKLWDNEVLPFLASARPRILSIVKTKTARRLLHNYEEVGDPQGNSNNDDDRNDNNHDNRDNRDNRDNNDNNDNRPDDTDNEYRDKNEQQFENGDNYTQNYVNWTITQWNAATWTSQPLNTFANMNITRAKGWTQVYFLFKAVETSLNSSNNTAALDQVIYQSLFIMDEVLSLTRKGNGQWNHLARVMTKVSGKNWSGKRLDSKVAELAQGKTTCSACQIGYFFNTQTSACETCSSNCMECSNSTSCTKCDKGYFSSNGVCSACESTCSQCSGNATSCTSCAYQLSLSGSSCLQCSSTCSKCQSSNLNACTQCIQPYSIYPNQSGVCYKCYQQSCSQCSQANSSTCLTCVDGYGVNNSVCIACGGNCQSCSISGATIACYACLDGFVLTNNTCLKCGPGCIQCSETDYTICKACYDGLYLQAKSATCKKCSELCLTCSSKYICTSYRAGKTNYVNSVVDCRPGCSKCNSSDPSVCSKCDQRFYLEGGVCKQCKDSCVTCTNQATCTKCTDQTFLVGGSCQKCSGNCKTCNSSNLSQCLTCKRGYKLSAGSCSQKCDTGCSSCSSTNGSVCLSCSEGYALKDDGTCVKCLGSCTGTCDPKNVTQCLGCMEGFQLSGSNCEICPRGCSSCLNTHCQQCNEGHRFIQTVNQGFDCGNKCKFPCESCSSVTGTCRRCADGFIRDSTTGACSPDISCNPTCSFCVIGTQRNSSTGNCVLCPSNCATCQNSVCATCFDGYYASSGSCSACSAQCFTCYDSTTCITCSNGYVKQVISGNSSTVVYSDKCIACDTSCLTCETVATRCTSCSSGFYLRGSKCVGNYNVKYQYKLSKDYSEFLKNSQSQNFTSAICQTLGIPQEKNTIDYIKQGSTVVGGTVSANNQSQANTFQSTLSSSGNKIGNYTVISSSIQVYDNSNPNQDAYQQNQRAERNKKIGIIVGSVVGGVALIVIIVVVACCCCKKKKTTRSDRISIGSDDNRSAGAGIVRDDKPQIGTAAGSANGDNNVGYNFSTQYFQKK